MLTFKLEENTLKKLKQKTSKDKYIILHCSDSDIKSHDNPETIDKWHRERGWTCIGYHFVITQNGDVWACRPKNTIGSHVKGYNNNSIGICVTGRNNFTPEQLESLEILIKRSRQNDEEIRGHYELDSSKTCPNFNVNNVREAVLHYDF